MGEEVQVSGAVEVWSGLRREQVLLVEQADPGDRMWEFTFQKLGLVSSVVESRKTGRFFVSVGEVSARVWAREEEHSSFEDAISWVYTHVSELAADKAAEGRRKAKEALELVERVESGLDGVAEALRGWRESIASETAKELQGGNW